MDGGGGRAPARRIMVVADPTRESAAALQWALSHAVLERDELILFHVENPNSWRNTLSTFLRRTSTQPAGATSAAGEEGGGGGGSGGGDMNFLEEMKHVSEAAQPKVRVRSVRGEIEGKDKAGFILSQTAALGIDLLVIGQRRSFSTAILGHRRAGGSTRGSRGADTAEYLIENSRCTCVGVQRKGQNAGFLLNTKTQKNFWLLA